MFSQYPQESPTIFLPNSPEREKSRQKKNRTWQVGFPWRGDSNTMLDHSNQRNQKEIEKEKKSSSGLCAPTRRPVQLLSDSPHKAWPSATMYYVCTDRPWGRFQYNVATVGRPRARLKTRVSYHTCCYWGDGGVISEYHRLCSYLGLHSHVVPEMLNSRS